MMAACSAVKIAALKRARSRIAKVLPDAEDSRGIGYVVAQALRTASAAQVGPLLEILTELVLLSEGMSEVTVSSRFDYEVTEVADAVKRIPHSRAACTHRDAFHSGGGFGALVQLAHPVTQQPVQLLACIARRYLPS
jgi:hypothetical protein